MVRNKAAVKIGRREFARRRKRLMGMMEAGSIAILAAAPEKIRSRDTEYAYRQDSDFYYLSGFVEPEAVLALIPGRRHGEFVMFCRERDPEKELWNGYRQGPEGACANFAADDAFPIDDIDDILPGLIEGRKRVYYSMGRDQGFDHRVMSWVNTIRGRVRSGASPPGEFLDLDHFLHEMRLFKSATEIRVMKRAGEIAATAHKRAMQACRADQWEYQLEAEILHEFALRGARFPAYNTIVGGGRNACILHYVDNAARLQSGDLVLIDAGCEYEYYASDITRTFPVSGRFSEEQAALYQIVLDAQAAALAVIAPGRHWEEPHNAAVKVITAGLLRLGLLSGKLKTLLKEQAYKPFFMHRTGHWLGIDVHDVGDYRVDGEWRLLEPGMCMTVEPGIYVAPDDDSVEQRWRGIGIRIEDDVVVTAGGCEILSPGAPRTIAEIEACMAGDAA